MNVYAKKLGGDLSVHSRKDQGNEFTIEIPKE